MLPKLNRLRKEREFQQVFKKSRPVYFGNLQVRVVERKVSPEVVNRFGFIISNKTEKRSARRNAQKRQLRVVARALLSALKPGYDIVVFLKKTYDFPLSQEVIRKDLVGALEKTGILKDAKIFNKTD